MSEAFEVEAYIVTWVSMENPHEDQEAEYDNLQDAQRKGLEVSELGGHCITVCDSEGIEYPLYN